MGESETIIMIASTAQTDASRKKNVNQVKDGSLDTRDQMAREIKFRRAQTSFINPFLFLTISKEFICTPYVLLDISV